MNIDAESIALLSLILRDAPKDRQLILCVLARSNQVPSPIKFHSNTEYPTFYGYSNERMPFYLMGKKVISNVPREGSAKRLISSHYLAYSETAINGAGTWDLSQRLFFVSKFIKLDNQTSYKDAEVYLVFRDKAQEYIRDYVNQNREKISAFLGSKLGRFEFGKELLEQNEKSSDIRNENLDERYKRLLSEISSTREKDKHQKIEGVNRMLTQLTPKWSEDFKWQGNKQFVFGEYGVLLSMSMINSITHLGIQSQELTLTSHYNSKQRIVTI